MRLVNIHKIYHNKNSDVVALDNINLSFSNQGMTFIVGPSGCGKTTLLNIISGHDQDYEGEFLCDGKVESIEQEIMLFENLSIFDNLLLVSEDQERIHALLNQFQLYEPNKKVKKLSVGEKKRVQIIRSLLSEATYLICDEPTASLDHDNGEMIMALLKEISKDIGVIIVTHDIALVDKYQDRVIQMGKACVIADEEVALNENKMSTIIDKVKLSKQLSFIFKSMKSRKAETIFRFILLFFAVITVFVLISLYPSLNKSVSAQKNWEEGKNIIVSQPINDTDTEIRVSPMGNKQTCFKYYDVYHKEDLYLACDNIEGIIGYRMGWSFSNYALFGGSSFTPLLNIDGLREIVERYRNEYERTREDPVFSYSRMLETLEKIDKEFPNDSYPKDEYNFLDSHLLEGFELHDRSGATIPWSMEMMIENNDIVAYTLLDNVKLDLIYGSIPSTNKEIIISKDLAETLIRDFNLSSLEELIGKEINLSYWPKIENYMQVITMTYTNFKVSGITYMNSQLENQVFGYGGTFEKIFTDEYHYQPEIVAYQYMNLLIDPHYDSESIASQLNDLLESKNSHFIVLNSSETVNETYQDPIQMLIFASFALLALLSLYLCMHYLLNKRMKKENIILKRYQYHPWLMQVVMMLFLLLLVAIPQVMMLPQLCHWLNKLANSIGMASIVSYNTHQYLLSWAMVGITLIFVERGIYEIRTKKHS